MRTASQRRIEFASVALAVVVALGGFSYYFAQAADKSVFTKKQLELRNLATVILTYEISEDSVPRSPSKRDEWCAVDQYYGKKRCLEELERDGYLTSLPVSPDEYPYYYKYSRGVIYVGTPVTDGKFPDSENYCVGNNREVMWCYVIR